MRKRGLFIGLLAALFLSSCDEVLDYYLGIPQQPELTQDPETDEFNIFGVLRPDSVAVYSKSFVFVQRIWPALSFTSFSLIPDATVSLEVTVSPDSLYYLDFPLMPPDDYFNDSLYRPAEPFVPQPGQTYRIICEHPDLNTARGSMVFPPPPAIRNGSYERTGETVHFTLDRDTLIGMYDVYLSGSGTSEFLGRFIPDDQPDLEVALRLPAETGAGYRLKVFSYENNLAVYIGNSNTALNFNKYREGFSTLESGYGVFGGLNFIELDL